MGWWPGRHGRRLKATSHRGLQTCLFCSYRTARMLFFPHTYLFNSKDAESSPTYHAKFRTLKVVSRTISVIPGDSQSLALGLYCAGSFCHLPGQASQFWGPPLSLSWAGREDSAMLGSRKHEFHLRRSHYLEVRPEISCGIEESGSRDLLVPCSGSDLL